MFVLPDAELWLTGYLREALAGRDIYVSTKVPNPRNDRMVVVRRDGGPGDAYLDRPRFGISVWCPTDGEATSLAIEVRALLHAATNDGPCRRWTELSGPSPVADESGIPLRYMTGEAVLRGAIV